ncbi:MAG: M23 family metallopeptidase [Hydrogenoanaerobacterium sp.]
MNRNDKGNFSNFLNGKGFYVALALCLVGAGTAAWVVVDKTLGSITEPPAAPQASEASEAKSWSFPSAEEAGKAKTDIEMPSASSLPPQSSSSSAEVQLPAPKQYEQQALAPKQPISVYALPITSAEVFNKFSEKELVKNSTLGKWCTHDGIDLKAAKGTEVLCTADGTVVRVYDNGLWGKTVEVNHADELTSIYCGLSKDVPVHEGDSVKINQPLGTLGDSNLAEAKLESHLHFAMKQGGSYVNPLKVMGILK